MTTRLGKKLAVALLQQEGLTRSEARRRVYGNTRREASSHMTRGQHLTERIRVNAEARRSRRAQVLAATFTGSIVEGGL